MTMMASWVACDTHGISSAYIVSDSRITWDKMIYYDYGKKVFASSLYPELFGYAGDVLFPSIVLSQILELIDSGVLLTKKMTCSEKNSLVFEKICESISKYPDIMGNNPVHIMHISRDTEFSPFLSEIEFIICSADDNVLRIDCIKDGEVQYDCSSAWLGSYKAFREFQRIRVSDPTKSLTEMTESAFESVVQGGVDDSVGKFYISASYRPDLKCFWYSERFALHSVKEQTVIVGEAVKFFLDPTDGGYSYRLIPCGVDSLLMNIDQMEPMILFSRARRLSETDSKNLNLFGLMLPMLVKQKENGEIVRC